MSEISLAQLGIASLGSLARKADTDRATASIDDFFFRKENKLMTKPHRFSKWITFVLLAALLGGAVSGCIPIHGSAGHGGTAGHQHAH